MDAFLSLVNALHAREVRFVLIGVWGANYHAQSAAVVFTTQDHDLFLPPDPKNLLGAWTACDEVGLELSTSAEPLDRPRDLWLAERIVRLRALTRAALADELLVDLTLVMAGFEFETVWRDRRTFRDQEVEIPVARLSHIVASKATAGRPKDRLFLETHKEALRDLLPKEERPPEAS